MVELFNQVSLGVDNLKIGDVCLIGKRRNREMVVRVNEEDEEREDGPRGGNKE